VAAPTARLPRCIDQALVVRGRDISQTFPAATNNEAGAMKRPPARIVAGEMNSLASSLFLITNQRPSPHPTRLTAAWTTQKTEYQTTARGTKRILVQLI